MNIRIYPPDGMIEASVDLPYSKSVSARTLMINQIGGFNVDVPVTDCDDIKVLKAGLAAKQGNVSVGDSGTALRFLTAYYAASEGCDVILGGSPRLEERPISTLVDALRELGADVTYAGREGFAPLHIRGKKLRGGETDIDVSISSQFVSALMLVAPLMSSPLKLKFSTEPVSLPYIKMTAAMMEKCGVEPDISFDSIEVPSGNYTSPAVETERDWSAASYWYAVAAISAGWVTLNDMQKKSLQGDSAVIELGERLGVLTAESEDVDGALELSASPELYSRLDADMSATPDLVPALAVASAALAVPFRFTGVQTLHDKESDRIKALVDEALKLGLIFEEERNGVLTWESKRVPIRELPRIKSHGDHRIAMAFAPVSVFVPGIVIEDCEVVAKSYPDFWTHLEAAGFRLEDADKETAEE